MTPSPGRTRSFGLLLRRLGGGLSLSSASALVMALVLDVFLSRFFWAGVVSTALQCTVLTWLSSDFVRRKPWKSARRRAIFVELSTLLVVLLFLSARVHLLLLWAKGELSAALASDVLRGYGAVVLLASGASLWERSGDHLKFLSRLEFQPVQTVVLSFGLAILMGTMLLSLPFSVTKVEHVSLLDSLFVATSAVCVTGLSVVDVGSTYSRFGQIVLLVLFQAGGLGIMLLFAAFALLSGRRVSARYEQELGEASGAEARRNVRSTLRFILTMTFAIELLGALLLYPAMRAARPDDAVFLSIFHSVSAFCSAGFTTLERGLLSEHVGPWVLLVLALLIFLGGLGAPVMAPLWERLRGRARSLPLHPRLALWTSGGLVVLGFAVMLLLEAGVSLKDMSLFERLGHALFVSVSARSGGLDSFGIGELGAAGAVWVMMLMLIGASPGSTGGGLKTTTFAVLVLTLVAVLRRQNDVTAFGRRVRGEDVHRAMAIAWSGLSILALGCVVLLAVEPRLEPVALAFEAFSAFSTSGLSLGVTPELSTTGRLVVILMMFAGRLGPLTLLAAFFDRRRTHSVRYPEQHVQFG